MEQPPRPEVRAVGQQAPGPTTARPVTPARRARPSLTPLLALLAAAAAGYGLSQLQRAQQDARPRPPESAFTLASVPGSAVTVATAADGAVQVRVPVLVRNTGTDSVELRGATLDGLGARGSSRGQGHLEPGATARLLVAQDLRCPRTRRALQDAPEPGPLALALGAPGVAEQRVVRLPLPDGVLDHVHDVLGSACSHAPLSGALQLHLQAAALTTREVRLQVRVENRSDRPVDVIAVSAPAGFQLRLQTGHGRRLRLRLPVRVSPSGVDEAPDGAGYEVRIAVRPGGCDAARRSTHRGAATVPVTLPVTVVRDGEEQVLSQVDDDGLLRQLADATCR